MSHRSCRPGLLTCWGHVPGRGLWPLASVRPGVQHRAGGHGLAQCAQVADFLRSWDLWRPPPRWTAVGALSRTSKVSFYLHYVNFYFNFKSELLLP